MNKDKFIEKYSDALILFRKEESDAGYELYKKFCNACLGLYYARYFHTEVERQFDFSFVLQIKTTKSFPVFLFKPNERDAVKIENKKQFFVDEFVKDFISYINWKDRDKINLSISSVKKILGEIGEQYNTIERYDAYSIKQIKEKDFYPGYKGRNAWVWWNTTGRRIVIIFGIGTFEIFN